ncbi:MAG: preprotein translocase subunit SecA [Sumerlaeia bacterium]
MLVSKFMRLILGDKQVRDMKKIMPLVDEINEVAAEYKELSDDDLKNKTAEFRRLLKVVPRVSRVGGDQVVHERAELLLKRHPDVEDCLFLGTRRDYHNADLVVFVNLKEGAKPGDDLAGQVREGMGRLGPNYKPKHVVFLDDELPAGPKGKGRNLHQIMRLLEEYEFDPWEQRTWAELKSEIPTDEDDGSYSVDDLLVDAFAAVKETCRRHIGQTWDAAGAMIEWNMVPFDVQLAGGIALHRGNIAEMATGEGKTLVAVAPLYLNGVAGRGSHLITVNEYLSRRDSEWMAPIFNFLGLSVGCIDKHDTHTAREDRRAAYRCDITYGTNNEFGFDYLRDNMAHDRHQLVQRDHAYAIIDEVDSVLIDEARTPLIIAGPVDRSNHHYVQLLDPVRNLVQQQQMLVGRFVKEAVEMFEKDEDSWEGARRLLQATKGIPKHNRLLKVLEDPRKGKLRQKVENDLMLQKKVAQKGKSDGIREMEEELFFVVDEKNRQIELTDKGREALSPQDPEYFVLPDLVDEMAKIDQDKTLEEDAKKAAVVAIREAHADKADTLHAISQLLHAYTLKIRDVDYVVEEGKVVIVDENTGRKMAGRRWSDGLHAAVEAKEGVTIEKETQTLATITIQNYFRLYDKLAGMTGTAETEAAEFANTYGMDVIVVPTNKPIARKDADDVIYKTKREKYQAVLEEVEKLHKAGLPVLVGTASVAVSETLARMFRAKKLPHNVLNAKNHAREAEIVAAAGQPGAITIATNMAGRGTDIKLGAGVKDQRQDEEGNDLLGGLQIVGTERHESRRIDRQLRGRAGRQGDPGASRFFVSLEDDLMMYFGGERLAGLMTKLGLQEGEAIVHPLVTRSIGKAQKKVEGINYERRKRTLEYDDVMNKQRATIYGLRRELLMEDDLRDTMLNIFSKAVEGEFESGNYGNPDDPHVWDLDSYVDWLEHNLLGADLSSIREGRFGSFDELFEAVMDLVVEEYDAKEESLELAFGPGTPAVLSRQISLRTIDAEWQDHLLAIDSLREGVNLRGYGQRDPLIEFTKDASEMFAEMIFAVNKEIFQYFFRAQVITPEEKERRRVAAMSYQKAEAGSAVPASGQAPQAAEPAKPAKPASNLPTYRRDMPKVGRNEPCPCGSGKKFKDCHGSPAMREGRSHTVPSGAEE